MTLDFGQGCLVHLACRVGPDRFERAHDRQVLTFPVAGLDGSSINKNGGDVHAPHGDQGSRHVLVAPPDGDHAVHALGADRRFDGVGDDFPGHQGKLHSFRSHRYSVRNRDGSEHLGHGSSLANGVLGTKSQTVQAHVAGCNGAVAIRHSDNRFFKIPILEPDGPEHGPVGRSFHSLGDGPASKWLFHGAFPFPGLDFIPVCPALTLPCRKAGLENER